jgi:hypothetical protein
VDGELGRREVFGATLPIVVTGSGSGDKIFDWVQRFASSSSR